MVEDVSTYFTLGLGVGTRRGERGGGIIAYRERALFLEGEE